MNISIFKYGDIGQQIEDFIRTNYPEHIKSIITLENFDKEWKFLQDQNLDFIILAWWPLIIKKYIIDIPKYGVINLHPSYLPYNRGKNYWFWNLVEDVPFGVTIHLVDKTIDGGPILFQKRIEKTWKDTGETLYNKARKEIVELFKENYPNLMLGYCKRMPQSSMNTVHYSKDLEQASEIHLDQQYTGKQILNLLRARSSPNYPGCYFYDDNQKYEVKISIRAIQ